MSPTGRVPRPRARVTFGRSPKSDQKRCLKPQVSRLPTRLGYAENRSCRKSKNRWFWAALLHPFAAEGKGMSRRSAKYSRRRQTCGRGCSPQSKNEKRAVGTPAPAGCATEAARNDPRPGRGIPFLHLTTKAQKIATQGQLFPPRVIVFRQAASKCALTGCLLSAFVCVILGNDSTNRDL